ncbi:MAG TPA: lactate racemase domain-containing protein, partial [Leptospiraceae bacterium]|nr:lactate racemase domain-containing protein [Leptospiraceae bacterium]
MAEKTPAAELPIEEHVKVVHSRLLREKPAPYVPKGEDDPEVVTIRPGAAKRAMFSGEDIVEIDLPVGSRVIYPKAPIRGLPDPDEAIRHALMHPEKMNPLPHYLKPGMKVTICIDDISLPLPPMERPDMRERILHIV